MYPMRNQPAQRMMPPLPPATLVIDMRGEGEDVISMLEIEIRNLTEEMKQQDIRLWSSLVNFISFRAMEPLADEDLRKLRTASQQQNQQTTAPQPTDAKIGKMRDRTLTGRAAQLDSSISFPPQYQASNMIDPEDDQNDATTPHPVIAELVEVIDSLRNIRHNAVSDLGVDGTVGRNMKEPGVRIIFLTDARHKNLLESTACFAWYLKNYYRRLERANEEVGQQIPINVSVLCLNHQNTDQSVAPTRLIEGLRWEEHWDHLDALIISEKYREDIGRVDSDTQNLLAELLLYILLIVSPALARIRPSAPGPFEKEEEKPDEQMVSLPPNTFLVGLSSIENSTRWGYQLLNCGLAEQALQILLDGNPSNEQATAIPAVEGWLNELRRLVRSALPDRLPKEIPDIHALATAEKAATSSQGVFSNSQLSLTLGQSSIRQLGEYLDKLTATYISSDADQNLPLQQGSSNTHTTHQTLTLQDAIRSVPQIENALDQWDSSTPETPLVQAQLNAHRVLSHPRLFQGPHGALPRAKAQLRELANTTDTLQGKLAQNPIDLKAKQQALQQSGRNRINDLQAHIQKWPLCGSYAKVPMAWATMIFVLLFLCYPLVILSFVWLEQLFDQFIPGVFNWLNQPLLGASVLAPFTLLMILTLGILVFIIIFGFGRWVLDPSHSALWVDIVFGIVLLAIVLTGLFLALSSYGLITTQQGLGLLLWYPPTLRSWVIALALLFLILMIIAEIFYYSWWRKELELERTSIAEDIKAEHLRNTGEVAAYIADRLTLHLLTNAGLSDENTRNSPYYRRIDELNNLLTNTHTNVKEERRLAEGRLGSNLGESSLRIRQELLDVAALKRGYKRIGTAMVHKRNELKDLTEILLRTMSEEMPHHIERQFREKAPSTDREAYYMQILMQALTTVALRFSTTMPTSDMLTPLEERYKELDDQSTNQLSTLRVLIDTLNKKVQTSDLDENESGTGPAATKQLDVKLASQALAAWSQILWERKDPELSSVLAPGGVIAKLISQGYSSQTVKETLGIRTSPSGRSLIARLHDDLYLFVSHSPESRKFLRDFLPERYIAEFPDPERLLLLHIQHYVAQPMVVTRKELGSGPQSHVVDSTATGATAGQSANSNNGTSTANTTNNTGGATTI